MGKRKPKFTDGWEWLRTEDFSLPWLKRKEPDAVAPLKNREAAGMLAIGAVVVFGLAGLMRWQSQQARATPQPEVVYVETPAEPVRSVAIRVPKTAEGFERIRESATAWMRHLHQYRDDQIAALVWNECWHDVVYPGPPQPGDHPTVARAHAMVRTALLCARAEVQAERVARGEPVFEDTSRAEDVIDGISDGMFDDAPAFAAGELDFDDVAALPTEVELEPAVEVHQPVGGAIDRMTHERPTPGYFFRVDDETVEGGIEGLASLGVLSGLLEAAHAKGWSVEQTMGRANQVAEQVQCVIDYEALIRQSEWNAKRIEPLLPGSVLWLPPIKRAGLLSRRQSPQVSLDPRSWADGSSRIEPPPDVRPRWGLVDVARVFGRAVT